MSGATTWCVVYNGSEYSQIVDEEGRSVDPGTFACARRSTVRHLLDDSWLIAVDTSVIGPDSNPAARLAAEEADRRNAAIDADKEKDEVAPKKTAAKSDSTKNK